MHLLALLQAPLVTRLRSRLSAEDGWADLTVLLATVTVGGVTAAAVLAGDWSAVGTTLITAVTNAIAQATGGAGG